MKVAQGMDSVFQMASMSDEDFDTIFDQEDDLIDTVNGVDENGDPLTGAEFDDLHNTEPEDMTADEFKDDLENETPESKDVKDAEGTEGWDESDEEDFDNLHNVEDDNMTAKDFIDDLEDETPESKDVKDAEGTEDWEDNQEDNTVKGKEDKDSCFDKWTKDSDKKYQDDKNEEPDINPRSVDDTIEDVIEGAYLDWFLDEDTEEEEICPKCGKPMSECTCSLTEADEEEDIFEIDDDDENDLEIAIDKMDQDSYNEADEIENMVQDELTDDEDELIIAADPDAKDEINPGDAEYNYEPGVDDKIIDDMMSESANLFD